MWYGWLMPPNYGEGEWEGSKLHLLTFTTPTRLMLFWGRKSSIDQVSFHSQTLLKSSNSGSHFLVKVSTSTVMTIVIIACGILFKWQMGGWLDFSKKRFSKLMHSFIVAVGEWGSKPKQIMKGMRLECSECSYFFENISISTAIIARAWCSCNINIVELNRLFIF